MKFLSPIFLILTLASCRIVVFKFNQATTVNDCYLIKKNKIYEYYYPKNSGLGIINGKLYNDTGLLAYDNLQVNSQEPYSENLRYSLKKNIISFENQFSKRDTLILYKDSIQKNKLNILSNHFFPLFVKSGISKNLSEYGGNFDYTYLYDSILLFQNSEMATIHLFKMIPSNPELKSIYDTAHVYVGLDSKLGVPLFIKFHISDYHPRYWYWAETYCIDYVRVRYMRRKKLKKLLMP